MANKIVSKSSDAIGLENLNVAGMLRRCRVKVDETTGRFLKNGQLRKKALNRSISDAAWTELTLKVDLGLQPHVDLANRARATLLV